MVDERGMNMPVVSMVLMFVSSFFLTVSMTALYSSDPLTSILGAIIYYSIASFFTFRDYFRPLIILFIPFSIISCLLSLSSIPILADFFLAIYPLAFSYILTRQHEVELKFDNMRMSVALLASVVFLGAASASSHILGSQIASNMTLEPAAAVLSLLFSFIYLYTFKYFLTEFESYY
ncbi:MAG: hypothetical protein QXR62_04415 [Candidatus Bathyarchaeia archaeon]